MGYFILKLIFRVALKIFYSKIEIKQPGSLPTKGPLLLVANHPNTFMDPIVIASLFQQEVYFIAKSTVFNTPFRKWLLGKMNLIPVYRREDGNATAGANEATFEKCYQFLQAAGTLLIFPEGNSFNERRLRPLKTGAARIALGAAARSNFNQPVTILPVGLNYAEPTRFRSRLFISVAAPIAVSQWAAVYQHNPSEAVKQLTGQIREALEAQVIHTYSQEDDALVKQVEAVFKNKLVTDHQVNNSAEEFELTRHIVSSLEFFKKSEPERINKIQEKLTAYLSQLNQLGLQDQLFYDSTGKRHLGKWLFTSGIFFVLGFPLYLLGLLTNYLPYIIPAKVAKALTEEEEFVAPILLSTGIFTFPLFYFLEGFIVWYLTHSLILLLLFLLLLPVAGFFVLYYYQQIKKVQATLKLQTLFFSQRKLISNLMQQRELLIAELDLARQQYLQKI
ncbi:1-acyl-sn-glycerol-3-phosphate acyltransferase [Adhaeribacter swui]|uniref:1-acyl-sn-glycerol-3-phosphate acyltransferase n=1 Tax=Adhaeribacter swui TaxID=2086471 RepID=A0A7G7G3U0_9BACT|nr:1-acyl-sn-glycerol-3-phosphate acyltransferase [Adhaeribacter swui]QNF31824.1 1-acyl-sn-glycerol-3-phosphate acyltransferase [Adhaeribacter swui]